MKKSLFFSSLLQKPLILLLSILLLFLFSTTVTAEDNVRTEENVIIKPLPLRLTPLWWDEIGQASHKDLKVRVEQLTRELSLINNPDEATHLASQVIELLSKYEAKLNTPLPVEEIIKDNKKTFYVLDDMFQIINRERNYKSEIELSITNKETLIKEISRANKKLNTIKLSYLNNKRDDTKKLVQGLVWMKSRLILSLLEVSRELVVLNEKLLEKKYVSLQDKQQIVLGLLQIDPEQVKQTEISSNLLEDKIKRINANLESLKYELLLIVSMDDSAIRERKALLINIMISTLKLKSHEAELISNTLIQDIDNFKIKLNNVKRSKVHSNVQKGTVHVEETNKWIIDISNRLEKEEEATNSLLLLKNNAETDVLLNKSVKLVKFAYNNRAELKDKLSELELLVTIADNKLRKTGQGTAILVEKADQTFKESWKFLKKWLSTTLFSLSGTPVTPLGLLHFLMILFIGWVLSKLFQRSIKRFNSHSLGNVQTSSYVTISRIGSFIIIGISLLVGFSSLGIDVTKLALVATALSIGIGFGLQNIINNFVSGIILLFERSVMVGDYIELANGIRGEVREINIRSTVINTNDNIDIIVPNSEFVNSSVTNWTMNDRFLRMVIPFGVAYGSDKDFVRDIVIEAALSLPYTLNQTERQFPQIRLAGFGDSSLNFELVVWVKGEWANRPGRVKTAYIWEIESTLTKNNVEIPFPQREVRILDKDSQYSD